MDYNSAGYIMYVTKNGVREFSIFKCFTNSLLIVLLRYIVICVGVDTDKDSKEPYKPHFMHHFNKEPDHNKKQGNKKNAHVGPQSIYAYFPSIPEGTEFKDYVSVWRKIHVHVHVCTFVNSKETLL